MKNLTRYYPASLIIVISFVLFQSFVFHLAEKEVTVEIRPVFGNKNLILEKQNYITANGDTVSISRLRFYVSQIQFTFNDGSIYNEVNSYHLIDAEEPGTLKIQLADVPASTITSIRFNVGVDSLASVSGALDGDLDPVKGMYWAWNSGYINAKLEGKYSSTNKEFEFHVGGYLPPQAAIRKVSININAQENEKRESLVIVADIQAWFKNIQLSKTNRIVMPGADAMKMADSYVEMFRLEN